LAARLRPDPLGELKRSPDRLAAMWVLLLKGRGGKEGRIGKEEGRKEGEENGGREEMVMSVGLSSALWKNGGSDSDAVWHNRSDGSRNEADSVVWGSVHGKRYFWGRICGEPL